MSLITICTKVQLQVLALGVSILVLRCGRNKICKAAASVGVEGLASEQEVDAFIRLKAQEFKDKPETSQQTFMLAAPDKRTRLLTKFGSLLSAQGVATENLQHGVPGSGGRLTPEGAATLYGLSSLADLLDKKDKKDKDKSGKGSGNGKNGTGTGTKNQPPQSAAPTTTAAATANPTSANSAAATTATATKVSTGGNGNNNGGGGGGSAAKRVERRLAELMRKYPLAPDAMRAVLEYAPNRARCANCGRFASTKYDHVCPTTTDPSSMERILRQRLNLPSGSGNINNQSQSYYTDPTTGQNGLALLIQEAKTKAAANGGTPTIGFTNPVTGAGLETTLDGALLALQQGYVPDAWQSQPGLTPVQVLVPASTENGTTGAGAGRVVTVLDGAGLLGPSVPQNPVEQAALAHGLDPAWVRQAKVFGMAKANNNSSSSSNNNQSSAGGVGSGNQIPQPQQPGGGTGAGAGAGGVVVVKLNPNTGSVYDAGRFAGREFNKGRGNVITDPNTGQNYMVGQRINDPTQYSLARQQGYYPQPKGGTLVAGSTLVQAAAIAASQDTVGKLAPDGKFELYDKKRGLVAVYDPQTSSFGAIDNPTNANGEPCATPEQYAALIAYTAQHPNPNSAFEMSLAGDLQMYAQGNATALQVSDGAYVLINSQLSGTTATPAGSRGFRAIGSNSNNSNVPINYTMGIPLDKTTSGVTRCPDCGKFMGASGCVDSHNTNNTTTTNTNQQPQPQPQSQPIATATGAAATATTATTAIATSPASNNPTNPSPANSDPAEASAEEPKIPIDVKFDITEDTARTLTDALAASFSPAIASLVGQFQAWTTATAASVPTATATSSGNGNGGLDGAGVNTSTSTAVTQQMQEQMNLLTQAVLAQQERTTEILGAIAERLAQPPQVQIQPLTVPVSVSVPPAPGIASDEGNGNEAVVTRSSAPVSTTTSAPSMPTPPVPVPRERIPPPPRPKRPASEERNGSQFEVERLLATVEPLNGGETDPYLSEVDPTLGGDRFDPLPQYYQELDENYEIDDSSRKAIRGVGAALTVAWNPDPRKRPRGTQFRAFCFAGTSGTGKNTTARQVAAGLNLPYYELTLNKDTSPQEEIGQTVLTTDPQTGATVSRAQLGKLGQAAASGAVICINELVKANPGTLGALQTMMEDGYVEIAGTEAGMKGGRIPVHPNTVFIGTFNPGYEGAGMRPDHALLSRMQTFVMNAPSVEEQSRRLDKELSRMFGEKTVSPNLTKATAAFIADVQKLATPSLTQGAKIAASSPHPAAPTPREAVRFATLAHTTGDPLLALEGFKVFCDAGESFDDEWAQIQLAFDRHFGSDGQAVARLDAGKATPVN
jgi:hypothetical protein